MSRRMFALGLLGLACGLAAQPDSNWSVRIWNVEDGLPRNQVSGLLQTPDGFLWLTTSSHLVRFDGTSFVEIPERQLGLADRNSVHRIMAGENGGLWLKPRNHRALYFAGGTARALHNGLPEDGLRHLVDLGAGELWANYDNGEVYRLKDGKVTRFGESEGLWTTGAQSFVADRDRDIWLARNGRIAKSTGDRFFIVAEDDKVEARVAAASSGGVWAVLGSSLLRLGDGGIAHKRRPYADALQDPGPLTLLEDRSGAVWIATRRSGLLRVTANTVETVLPTHRDITTLLQDRDGNIWAGTLAGGLIRIQRRAVWVHLPAADLSFATLNSITEDSSGTIWAVNDLGVVARHERDRWQVAEGLPAGVQGSALCVAAAPQGGIWIATRSGLVFLESAGATKAVGFDAGLVPRSIDALLVTKRGDVWLAGRRPDAVQRLRGSRFHTFKVGAEIRTVHALVEDAAGDVWSGSSSGRLLRFHGDEVVEETGRLGTASSVHTLTADDRGLWIGFGQGLGRLEGNTFKLITSAQGLHEDYVTQIIPDGLGWLWIGSSRGVFKLQISAIEAFFAGTSPSIHSYRLPRDAGLSGMQAVHGQWPNRLRDRSGRIWMPMHTGLAVIDPTLFKTPDINPQVVIREIRVDGVPIAVHGGPLPTGALIDLAKPNATVQLPPHHRHVEIDFTAVDLTAPDSLRFRSRLAGLDPDKIDLRDRRTITYSHLSPGTYGFSVEATMIDPHRKEPPASVAFVALPHVWETWWFRIGAAGLFTIGVAASVRYVSFRRLRASLLHAQEQAVIEQERSRIARDIHDDVGNLLTQILLIADGTRERHPEQAVHGLQEISQTAHRIVKSLDEIVWAINPANDTLSNLIGYVAEFSTNFLRVAGIPCVLDLPARVPDHGLPANVRHNLFLVVKEALHNAVRHARPTEIRVSGKIENSFLQLSVRDNGRGMPGARPEIGSDGLQNMRHRMAAIGGTLEVQTVEGHGTVLTLHYTLNRQPSTPAV